MSTRNAFFSAVAIFCLAAIQMACNPTDCTQTTSIVITNQSGKCFNVSVSASDGSDSFQRNICASETDTIIPGKYTYTVSENGTQVAQGTQEVACGDTLPITLSDGTPNPNPTPSPTPGSTETTVQGTPVAVGYDLGCSFTNPENTTATVKWIYYTYGCSNAYSNVYTMYCTSNCQVGANASVSGALPIFDSNCYSVVSSTCSVRISF